MTPCANSWQESPSSPSSCSVSSSGGAGKRLDGRGAAHGVNPRDPLRFLYLLLGLVIAHAYRSGRIQPAWHDGWSRVPVRRAHGASGRHVLQSGEGGRFKYVPLGLTAPFLILVGVAASLAIRPLLGDAKNAALAEDFVGAVIILGRVRPADAVVPAMAEREPVLTLT